MNEKIVKEEKLFADILESISVPYAPYPPDGNEDGEWITGYSDKTHTCPDYNLDDVILAANEVLSIITSDAGLGYFINEIDGEVFLSGDMDLADSLTEHKIYWMNYLLKEAFRAYGVIPDKNHLDGNWIMPKDCGKHYDTADLLRTVSRWLSYINADETHEALCENGLIVII